MKKLWWTVKCVVVRGTVSKRTEIIDLNRVNYQQCFEQQRRVLKGIHNNARPGRGCPEAQVFMISN